MKKWTWKNGGQTDWNQPNQFEFHYLDISGHSRHIESLHSNFLNTGLRTKIKFVCAEFQFERL